MASTTNAVAFDLNSQTLENCRFVLPEDVEVQIVTSKEPASGKFRAAVVRTEGEGRKKKRTVFLLSDGGVTPTEAFELLHTKSAEALHNHVSALGYSIVRGSGMSGKKKRTPSGWSATASGSGSSDSESEAGSGSDSDSDSDSDLGSIRHGLSSAALSDVDITVGGTGKKKHGKKGLAHGKQASSSLYEFLGVKPGAKSGRRARRVSVDSTSSSTIWAPPTRISPMGPPGSARPTLGTTPGYMPGAPPPGRMPPRWGSNVPAAIPAGFYPSGGPGGPIGPTGPGVSAANSGAVSAMTGPPMSNNSLNPNPSMGMSPWPQPPQPIMPPQPMMPSQPTQPPQSLMPPQPVQHAQPPQALQPTPPPSLGMAALCSGPMPSVLPPFSSATVRDVRIAITWTGHESTVRIFARCAASKRSIGSTAVQYIVSHREAFGPEKVGLGAVGPAGPAGLGGITTAAQQQQQPTTLPQPAPGPWFPLRHVVKEAVFRGNVRYDLRLYHNDDLTRMCDTAGAKDIPLFEVTVTGRCPQTGGFPGSATPPGVCAMKGIPASPSTASSVVLEDD